MALNIPMPGAPGESLLRGLNLGSNMFDRIVGRNIEREQLAQQMQIHQDALKQNAIANARAAQAAADRHKLALMQMDPNREINLMRRAYEAFGGQKPPMKESAQLSFMPSIGEQQPQVIPEINQQAVSPMEAMETQQGPGGMDMEVIKNSPILRGFFKKHFGVDPGAQAAQTPEQKNAAALDLFKEKEKFKANQERALPGAVKTLHENIIHLSPKAIDAIQHIIDIPSPTEPWGMGFIKSGQKAAHNKSVTAAAENYAKAKGWPNTKGSIEKAESILQRGNFETDFDYRKRLREYQEELRQGIRSSSDFLHPGKSMAMPQSNNNIIEYHRVNGKLVPKKG